MIAVLLAVGALLLTWGHLAWGAVLLTLVWLATQAPTD